MVSRAISAVRNKAQVWVFEALQQIRERLPFELLGLDSDNGAEFINYQLHRYCEQEQITFTRSRPLRKNDNCFVEQKNYSVVRRFAGYARYDTETELEVLNQAMGTKSWCFSGIVSFLGGTESTFCNERTRAQKTEATLATHHSSSFNRDCDRRNAGNHPGAA